MTMRTARPIACECGHKGELRCSENDAPYSAMYESYLLHGFDGSGATFTSWPELKAAGPILKYLNPKCPSCGAIGKVSYCDSGAAAK